MAKAKTPDPVDDDIDLVQADPQTREEDQYDRRRLVLFLRGRRMSVKKISDALGVGVKTVSHDLAWIRQQGAKVFGTHPDFDPNAFIWESLCRFEDIESTALRDSMTKDITIRDKMLCLGEAREARTSMVMLLMDTGQLQRAPVNVNVHLPTASQIRQAVADAMQVDEDVIDLTVPQRAQLVQASAADEDDAT
jgi:hypothetical protein